MYGGDRQGDNLYTASFVALDADSGKLRWHYQFTPHDVWDYDATHVPVLADIMFGGQRRKVVLNANRNGFFYVIDRETGKLLLGEAVRPHHVGDGDRRARAGRSCCPTPTRTSRGRPSVRPPPARPTS